MKEKLTMKLIVDGEEKQKVVGEVIKQDFILTNPSINTSTLKISGESHINPEGLINLEIAVKTFEAIRTDYEKEGKIKEFSTIEINYSKYQNGK